MSYLVSYTQLSPNHSGGRTRVISRITPHCAVGQISCQSLGEIFSKESRQASSNYGIGFDGKVGMYVPEEYRSWCTSSNDNDQRAITIECASDKTSPYKFNDNVYTTLVDLCTDICERYSKKKLLWISDQKKALDYDTGLDEMLLTVHRWFSATECPGEWLIKKLPELSKTVTERLQNKRLYRVQIGAFTMKKNAEKMVDMAKQAGFTDAFIV